MTELQAVLFDMDGTLVETESLWHESEVVTMAKFGATWSLEEQKFALGGPFEVVVDYMAQKVGSTPAAVGDALLQSMIDLMKAEPLTIQPGIRELYDEIRAAGLTVGLVTNSFRVLADIALESTGFKFDVVVTGDEVAEPKPHPMPYLRACELLGVGPDEVVVLEDSSTGIESATRAGCAVIAIPHLAAIAEADRQLVVASVEEVNLAVLRAHVA